MKILITGGTGFIGKRIVNKIKNKTNKILIFTRSKSKIIGNIEYFHCNLFRTDSYYEKLQKFEPEIVIHCAWYGIPNLNKENSNKNYKFSVKLMKYLLNLKSIKKLLVAGSCFEIKNKKNKVDEKCNVDNISYFSKSKIKLLKFIKKNIKKKQKYYWLRIFYAYGPGQRKESIIPSMIKNLKLNKKFKINNPNKNLDFIFIDDVAIYFKKVIEKNLISGIYNVGTGNPISLKKIYNKLKIKINKKYSHKIYEKLNDFTTFYASTKKTEKNLDWKPKIKINIGLNLTLESKW